jgi:hypothetical protein
MVIPYSRQNRVNRIYSLLEIALNIRLSRTYVLALIYLLMKIAYLKSSIKKISIEKNEGLKNWAQFQKKEIHFEYLILMVTLLCFCYFY